MRHGGRQQLRHELVRLIIRFEQRLIHYHIPAGTEFLLDSATVVRDLAHWDGQADLEEFRPARRSAPDRAGRAVAVRVRGACVPREADRAGQFLQE